MIEKKITLDGHQLQILRWLYFFTLRELEIAPYLLKDDFKPVQHNVVDNNKFGIQILPEGYDEQEAVKDTFDQDISIVFIVEAIDEDLVICDIEAKCVDERLDDYFLILWESLLKEFQVHTD